MNQEEYRQLWNLNFPEAHPIGYEFKNIYSKRWFRIHSLPESKRYAETEEEYKVILNRQNELVVDLIGENKEVVILFGKYSNDITNKYYEKINEFKTFTKVDTLELHKLRPAEHEDEELYLNIYAKRVKWIPNKRDKILRLIADDEIRIIIVCVSTFRIIYPYDGGVDIILESEDVRDLYKKKYTDWLSIHPSGW